MADAPNATADSTDGQSGMNSTPIAEKEKVERREIKGGIPYTTSPGVLKKALELIVSAERPDKFSANFMDTVLKLTAIFTLTKQTTFASIGPLLRNDPDGRRIRQSSPSR